MNDHTRPRPEVRSHFTAVDRQYEHIGRGGMRHLPHAPHACTSNSPRAHPNQNSLAVGSSRSGSNHPVSTGHTSLTNSIADVGTPSPDVTRDTSAPSTCEVELPRIWRTPSSTKLNPCTYASDIPPPEVFTGRRPLGH